MVEISASCSRGQRSEAPALEGPSHRGLVTLHNSSDKFEGDRLGADLIAWPWYAGARASVSMEKQGVTPLRILRDPSIQLCKPTGPPARFDENGILFPSEDVLQKHSFRCGGIYP